VAGRSEQAAGRGVSSPLAALQRSRPHTIRKFLYAHNARRADRIESLLARVPQARPLTTDAAVIEPAATLIQALARQLRELCRSVTVYDQQIRELFAAHSDAPLFQVLPGAGPVLAPRLLVAFGSDRERFQSAEQLQSYAGVAPLTQASGKQRSVRRRRACPRFLRQSFHEFATQSLKWCQWARAYYRLQRQRGSGRHTAIRALAYKWIRILYRCWKSQTPYDEAKYLESLGRRRSPLLERIQSQAA
jgi:transposase